MSEQHEEVLRALENLERVLRRTQEADEERERLREYVRREHVPFLGSRMRTFDEYLAQEHPQRFRDYTRVTPSEFGDLYERLAPHLTHPITHRSPISPQLRLFTFLRFVGHGYSFSALAEELHCGKSTIGNIVHEVGAAIKRVVYPEAFPPITRAVLEEVAIKTQRKYDYPRAVGFLDGKHIHIKKPAHSGSRYFNYKKRFSIILLAVVDCDECILTFDVGAPGGVGDAGAFMRSGMKRFYDNGDHLFPPTRQLGNVGPVQYHILVDSGFGQGHRYVRPYSHGSANTASKKRFNRKHSGARQQVERTFGILRSRFRVLDKAIELEPDRVMELVASLLVRF